jgi:hypothetical protein
MNIFLSKMLIGKSDQEMMGLGSELLSDFDSEEDKND